MSTLLRGRPTRPGIFCCNRSVSGATCPHAPLCERVVRGHFLLRLNSKPAYRPGSEVVAAESLEPDSVTDGAVAASVD
jgi:hypothetical protein